MVSLFRIRTDVVEDDIYVKAYDVNDAIHTISTSHSQLYELFNVFVDPKDIVSIEKVSGVII